VLYPFFPYFDDFDYYPEPAEVQASPPQVVVIREPQESAAAPTPPAPNPQVTEVSTSAPAQVHAAARAAEKRPTIFLLADGREIRAQRYTITDHFVYVVEARSKTLKIPLGEINVEATVARNRLQGIDLQIPTAANEYFLSF
jgi:hypothetical protein